MNKFLIPIFFLLISFQISFAQDKSGSEKFWATLSQHCGKSYEGENMTPSENDPFTGKRIVMHVVDCGDNFFHIPLFVGDDKSNLI